MKEEPEPMLQDVERPMNAAEAWVAALCAQAAGVEKENVKVWAFSRKMGMVGDMMLMVRVIRPNGPYTYMTPWAGRSEWVQVVNNALASAFLSRPDVSNEMGKELGELRRGEAFPGRFLQVVR